MENPTGFDLNSAIQSWRESLSQSPRLQPENLGELESHLRDSVDLLRTRGLSEEEAFSIAIRRLGNLSVLEAEFAKVNRKELWLNRLLWMLAGVLLWRMLNRFANAAGEAAVAGGLLGLGYQPRQGTAVSVGLLLGLAQLIFVLLGSFACMRLWPRIRKRLNGTVAWVVQSRIRMVLGVIAVSLMVITGFGLSSLEIAWAMSHMNHGAESALMYSKGVASLVTSPLEIIAMVGGVLVLVRRRFGRKVRA